MDPCAASRYCPACRGAKTGSFEGSREERLSSSLLPAFGLRPPPPAFARLPAPALGGLLVEAPSPYFPQYALPLDNPLQGLDRPFDVPSLDLYGKAGPRSPRSTARRSGLPPFLFLVVRHLQPPLLQFRSAPGAAVSTPDNLGRCHKLMHSANTFKGNIARCPRIEGGQRRGPCPGRAGEIALSAARTREIAPTDARELVDLFLRTWDNTKEVYVFAVLKAAKTLSFVAFFIAFRNLSIHERR
jgi:hypothetical protein